MHNCWIKNVFKKTDKLLALFYSASMEMQRRVVKELQLCRLKSYNEVKLVFPSIGFPWHLLGLLMTFLSYLSHLFVTISRLNSKCYLKVKVKINIIKRLFWNPLVNLFFRKILVVFLELYNYIVPSYLVLPSLSFPS